MMIVSLYLLGGSVALVYNVIQKVANDPQMQTAVEVSLSWDKEASTVAYSTSDEVMTRGPFRALTDHAGFWSAELTPNSEIEPASVYKVVEATPGGETAVYYIAVTDEDDSWVVPLLVPAPEWAAGLEEEK